MIKLAWICSDHAYKSGFSTQLPENLKYNAQFNVGSESLTCFDFGDTIIIAVRGSDDFKDWIENAELTDGFQKGANDFKEIVAKLAYGKDVIFTGHSRGGAIATFLAEYCAYILQNPCSCITFACPKPAKKGFRDYYNKLPIDHTNVYIQGDIVATSWLHYALGYRHVGKCIELPSKLHWKILRPYGRVQAHLRENLTKAINERFKDEK